MKIIRFFVILCALWISALYVPTAFASSGGDVYWANTKLNKAAVSYYARNQYDGIWTTTEPTDYSVKFDPATNTMYFYNYSTYGVNHSYLGDDFSAAIYATGDLHIVNEGTTLVTDANYSKQNTYGLRAEGDVTITGSGSFTIRPFESTFDDTPDYFTSSYGMYIGGNLTIDGVTVHSRGGNTNRVFDKKYGVKAGGSVSLQGEAKLTAQAYTKNGVSTTESYGLYAQSVSMGQNTVLDTIAYLATTCGAISVRPAFVDCDAYLFGRGNPVLISTLEKSDLYYSGSSVHIEANNGAPAPTDPEIVYSGNCGDSANFVLRGDGTLTITGVGKIRDSFFHTSLYMSSIKTIVIDEGITEIGERNFQGSSFLTSVVLPSTLKSIGNSAFQACRALETITFPDGLDSIGGTAFYACDNLKSVTIPTSVTYVGGGAFMDCSSLTSFTMNGTDTLMIGGVVANCPLLEKVVLSAGTYFIEATDRSGTIFGENPLLTTAGPIGSGCDVEFGWTTEIPARSFVGLNKSLAAVYIPATVTGIGYEAFYSCYALRDVYFGGSEETWDSVNIADYNNSLYWLSTTYHFAETCYHRWGFISQHDENGHYRICSVCGRKTYGSSVQHTYSEWFVSKTPTPAEPGTISRICTGCHYTETKTYAWGDRFIEETAIDIVREVVNGIVKDVTDGKSTVAVSAETADAIREAAEKGYSISATPVFLNSPESDIPWLDRSLILEFIYKEFGVNFRIGQYLDISIIMTADTEEGDSEVLGAVRIMNQPITYNYTIPADLRRPGRSFYIVHDHDNIVSRIPVTDNDDGTLSFEMSSFSTYALVYEDADSAEEVTNMLTLDGNGGTRDGEASITIPIPDDRSAVDLDQYPFTKENAIQIGWEWTRPSGRTDWSRRRTYNPDEYPAAEGVTTFRAKWAETPEGTSALVFSFPGWFGSDETGYDRYQTFTANQALPSSIVIMENSVKTEMIVSGWKSQTGGTTYLPGEMVPLGDDVVQLYPTLLEQLETPINLHWGDDYLFSGTGSAPARIPGMVDWEIAGGAKHDRMLIRLYRVENDEITFVAQYNLGWRVGIRYFSASMPFVMNDMAEGSYCFTVQALGDNETYLDSEVSEMSPVYEYAPPKDRLAAPQNLRWNGEVMAWDPTTDGRAIGYYLRYYRRPIGSTNSDDWKMCGDTSIFRTSVGNYVLPNKARESGYEYDFRLITLSRDMTVVRSSAYSAFSPAQNFSDTISMAFADQLNALEQASAADKREAANNAEALIKGTSPVAATLAADIKGEGTIQKLIQAVEQAKNLTATVVSDVATSELVSGMTVVGAGMNAPEGVENVKLHVTTPAVSLEVPSGYVNLKPLSMEITAGDSNLTEQHQTLAVPVKVTMPIPYSMDFERLVLLHYDAENSVSEIIMPSVYSDGIQMMASFVLESFSNFVLAEVLADATIKTGGVQVDVSVKGSGTAKVFCAVYDDNDRMLGVSDSEDVIVGGNTTLLVVCDTSKAKYGKAFFVDIQGCPVAEVQEFTILH